MNGRLFRFTVRVRAMAAKELLHVVRDPRTLVLALVMPFVMLLLFGFGVSFDLDRIPLAIFDGDRSEASRALVDGFIATHEFERVERTGAPGFEAQLRRGEVLAALVIPRGYARDLSRGRTGRAELLVDGSDATSANQVLQKADAVSRAQSQRVVGAAGPWRGPALEARTWTRYNPASRSAVFLVPGLTAYLMALGAVMLTALTVAGEWERGSMEQLFASPVGRLEIILGKLIPYLGLGILQLLLVVAVGASVFEVPIRGSLGWILVFGVVFLIGMLGQGLFISVVTKNQLVSTQASLLSAMLPSLLLSGMLFPIENMPRPLQWLSSVIPARYLVHSLRGILLKGSGIRELWPSLLAMAAFATIILTLATVRFRRRIA